MAEEIDIRSVWNRSKAKEDPSSLQINKLERKGTKNTLYWIRIILWIEFSLTIISMPFMIVYVTSRGDSLGLIAIYIFISVVYLFYYQFLIRQIRQFSYDGNVLANIKKLYGYLRFYILHYYVVFWISLVLSFIYAMMDPANEEVLSKIESTSQWVTVIAIWALLLAIVGGLFHLLIYLIYGRKIKRIGRMMEDLESEQ
ncbi:hypothetical protein [Ekhidna sp. To15]|uniref:hypothetical protein n=1 Tax=Ekhidna sp. To15 TaxID=3395267 RepID=UPI003F5277AF